MDVREYSGRRFLAEYFSRTRLGGQWLPQFVADRLNIDVFVYNRRINVDIPDGEPVAVVRPQFGNVDSIFTAGASAESVHRNQRPAKMFFIRLLTYSALRLGASCLAVAILCNAALGQDNTSTLIHGIMRNEMGKPVHNARVDVSTAAPISGPAVFSPSCYLERLD